MALRRYTLDTVSTSLAKVRSGKTVVLAAGTFDIIHPGHLYFLEACKKESGILVVCVAGNERVKRRKGEGRPFLDEKARAELLGALKVVDYVFISNEQPFDEEILAKVRPDVIVTSLDEPSVEKKIELKEYLEQRHPEIRLVFTRRGASPKKFSSREIINRILQSI